MNFVLQGTDPMGSNTLRSRPRPSGLCGEQGELHCAWLIWKSFIESWNHEGWKRPLRSSRPTVTPTPPHLLNHVPKCHIHTVFEPLQGWGLHHCPGQPGPTPDHSLSKEIFPNTFPRVWTQLRVCKMQRFNELFVS